MRPTPDGFRVDGGRILPCRRLARWLGASAAIATAGYGVMALVLGLLPVNASFAEDPDGITIYVRSNGFHAEIAMPIASRVADWRPELGLDLVPGPGEAVPSYVSFGWGERTFYIATRRWRDLRLSTTLRALAGGDGAAIRAEAVHGPSSAAGHATVSVSEREFARLVAFIRAHLRRDAAGMPMAIPGAGYGPRDRFFEAEGRYGLILTCNEWVRRALAEAGIRTARWAPFDRAVLYHLRQTR